jgi:hypothetical protein
MDLLKAIHELHGNSLVDENGIYYANGNPLTDEQLEQANILGGQMHKEFVSMQYITLRKREYDKLNQFDLQFQDSLDNGTRWVDAVKAIKAKYPKPV